MSPSRLTFQMLVLYICMDGLMQDCGNSIASALELPQSCNKPSMYGIQT